MTVNYFSPHHSNQLSSLADAMAQAEADKAQANINFGLEKNDPQEYTEIAKSPSMLPNQHVSRSLCYSFLNFLQGDRY